MLTSLTLKHWRTHAETTLEFGKGTNVIVGVMGSGKSSIVNAISYSLFGTFPALKSKQVSLNEIIMNKPNEQARAETILEFEQGESKYKIERIIKRDGTNEAKLYENSKLAAGPKQKDVNERVEKLLGLNYELFSRAVYSEQNETDFFLKLSPSERKRKFDELLELEKYEEARKNAVSVQNEFAKENKQRTELVNQQKRAIETHEEEKIAKQISAEEKEIALLKEEIEKATKEISEKEAWHKKEAEKENTHKKLEEQALRTKSRIETLTEEIEKNGKINLLEVTEKLGHIKKLLEENKGKIQSLEKEEKELQNESKKNGEELRVHEYENSKLTAEEKNVSDLKGKCPTCKQEMDETHKAHLLKDILEKKGKIAVEIKERSLRKAELKSKLDSVEKELSNKKRETENANRELYLLESQEKEAKQNDEKKKQLTLFKEELPAIEGKMKELNFERKIMEQIREDLYKAKNTRDLANSKISSKQELIKSYKQTIEKIMLIRKSIEEMEKSSLRAEDAAKQLGVFSNCLTATQVELRESMIETINNAMSVIWKELYPYKDFTDARLMVTPEGYDLQVLTRNNQWTRVDGILSGGERSAAAICIRMAFALVLTKKLSMLILDEPTHNLDSNAVSQLSTMLREQLPRLVEQIFVITHEKQMEAAASSNLYMLSRNKDTDQATQVAMVNAM